MFEERIRRVIRAERRADRPDADLGRLRVGADERHDFLSDVGVVLMLHPAAMTRMRAAVAERVAVVDVDAVQLDASGLDDVAERGDHTLPIELPFVAAAR